MVPQCGYRYVLQQLLVLGAFLAFSDGALLCRLNEVRCPSGIEECVKGIKICNGIRECSDGSDESPALCAHYNCSNRDSEINTRPDLGPTFYLQTRLCPSKKMCTRDPVYEYNPEEEDFITFFTCNGGPPKCVDGSDEDPRFCRGINCKAQPFGQYGENCPSGNFCLWPPNFRGGDVAKDFLCDGRKHCPDGSDEWPSFCKKHGCSFLASRDLQCRDGTCLRPEDVCNGVKDCKHGEDEAPSFCAKFNCQYSDNRKCSNNRTCLPDYKLCDGMKDCDDGSDEKPSFCRTFKCLERVWKCKDGLQCAYKGEPRFPDDPRCDGVPHCRDRSDEDPLFCKNTNCIKCPNGKECTSDYSLCDGKRDCSDGSDESPEFCKSFECPYARVKCGRGLCVDGALCDGRVDCDDGSDEKPSLCSSYKCPQGKTKCPGYPYQCIDETGICNGLVDCVNGGDENPAFCKKVKCPGTNINCNGTCTPGRFCDGNKDCPNGSDEDPAFCLKYRCPSDMVECNDRKQCVPAIYVCTGSQSSGCKDGTIFTNSFCSQFNCGTTGFFKCEKNSTRCLDPQLLCDGKVDCTKSKLDEDPTFCRGYKCPLGYVKCPNNQQCVKEGTLCDGKRDCAGGADEDPRFCAKFQCLSSQFACTDGLQCIDETLRCNAKKDCKDGSDEKYCLFIRNF